MEVLLALMRHERTSEGFGIGVYKEAELSEDCEPDIVWSDDEML